MSIPVKEVAHALVCCCFAAARARTGRRCDVSAVAETFTFAQLDVLLTSRSTEPKTNFRVTTVCHGRVG